MIAIVNSHTQNDLIELMGADEFQDLLVEAAIQFKERAAALTMALSQQKWTDVRGLAHKIKGSMGSLGYDALFQVLDGLEAGLLKEPVQLPTAEGIDEVHEALEKTRLALPAV